MKWLFLAVLTLQVSACISTPKLNVVLPPSAPKYPTSITVINRELTLQHIAGWPYDYKPEVVSRDLSFYKLTNTDETLLVRAPSILDDPAFCGEFQQYHRENDLVAIYSSESGNTILIMEDRSPAYQNREHLIFHKKPKTGWHWSTIEVPRYQNENQSNQWRNPSFDPYTEITGLNDHQVIFEGARGSPKYRLDLSKLVPGKSTTFNQP